VTGFSGDAVTEGFQAWRLRNLSECKPDGRVCVTHNRQVKIGSTTAALAISDTNQAQSDCWFAPLAGMSRLPQYVCHLSQLQCIRVITGKLRTSKP
jgi:hypothetical protein